ncbi:TPA: XRE family transcriptional regulator [Citrobacter freundii]|uniref:Helix-turn-helix domain-containing protein n=1 Tax=Citrobacter portucalensis TaxID=1639133 RepID=A0AAW5W826_9ENTR|nr:MULTISPECIES: helix-turn-helix domain-containing protein [Citrobacter freundii complex]ECZ1980058.1 helix-turn-helix domain-containing protein [Salmonella enterica]MCX9004578.1 helix-turn-helix domain-containing protein [Citrobacter portucalensis]MDK2581803.1 helix-turn-helix domain-containing protein [Citrobacter portucalensis]HAK6590663.1 helix-turn-helix domain-containing protein [Salmonella enterica]HAT2543020.1 helix-turn-helix domain-containing protein [Citrobacter freundii]
MKSNDDKIKREIGLRIQTLRKQSGMTAADLQSATGIGLSTLQNYEAGLRHPPIKVIQKIAKVLKAPAAYIACLSDEQFQPEKCESPALSGLVTIDNDLASPAGTKASLAIDRGILKSRDINPSNLSVIYSQDELMAPTIQPGSQVVIDKSVNAITNTGIYALEDEHGSTILRHCRVVPGDNTVMLSTQREAKENTDFIPLEDISRYRVIGRVVSVVNWL